MCQNQFLHERYIHIRPPYARMTGAIFITAILPTIFDISANHFTTCCTLTMPSPLTAKTCFTHNNGIILRTPRDLVVNDDTEHCLHHE